MNNDKEIHVRGLSISEVKKLNQLAIGMKFESKNQLILFVIRTFIEEKSEKNGEKSVEAYLQELSKSNEALLKQIKIRGAMLNHLEEKINTMLKEVDQISEKI